LTLHAYLQQIQQDGLQINTVYDIGANVGAWSVELKNTVLKHSYFYLFEGNSNHEASLRTTGLPYYIGILSNPGRDLVEYYTTASGSGTGDSYYRENTVFYDNTAPVSLPARTLESLVAECEMPVPNFLKIDTQGSELDILRGAETLLPAVDLIYLECPIGKYNLGAPNIQDYLEYMASQDFIPSDLLEIHTADRVLIQIDIMFINIATKDRLYGANHNNRYINY
jgi:FkbM family methyltransferase